MSTNQVIARHAHTSSFTFTGKPSDETRTSLIEAGFQFDAKSRQWYRREEVASVETEEVIAKLIAA